MTVNNGRLAAVAAAASKEAAEVGTEAKIAIFASVLLLLRKNVVLIGEEWGRGE